MSLKNDIVIFLADDHQLVAEGISTLLSKKEGVIDVKIFNNGKLLFDGISEEKPDLIFLDNEMPVWNGRKTLQEIKNLFPTIPCLMLSMINERAIIEECIEKGASAYLNKDCTFDELSEAIDKVLEGENYISKECLKSFMNFKKPDSINSFIKPDLSERELEILSYLCDGFSPKEIADKVFLSPRTVETHKTNIMQKFDVNSVGKLISLAIRNNVI